MTSSKLLVTGASGQLGRQVLELLLATHAGAIIATSRSPEKLADLRARGVEVRAANFDDEAGLKAAFTGAERALLISTDTLGVPGQRLAQHQAAVRAFESAGVQHVVYTSLVNPVASPILFAPDHAGTEAALTASGLDFTVLRNNLYTDLSLHAVAGAVASGQLIDSRARGAVAFVTREDCGRSAAAALADRNASGRRTLDVTGPESLTSEHIASLLSELSGKKITHVSVPLEALVQGMVQHGLPEPLAKIYASIDVSIARGDLASVSNTVTELTGRAPRTVREFLTANRAAFS